MKKILLHITCLLFSFSVAADEEELLARRLSVSFSSTPIRQALDEVARLADFEWSYNTGILELNKRVSFVARDWTVREILHELLGDGYAYKSSGRYLILKKQKPPKSELSGTVRDPKTGERLAHVTVYDRKTLRATTTDSSGYYRLKVKSKSEIVLSRLGYRDTMLQVSSITPRYQKIELAPVTITPDSSTSRLQVIRKVLQKASGEMDHFFAATLDKWHAVNIPDTLHRHFQLSLLPKIGTNHVLSGKVRNEISLNLLAGQSAGVRGAELAGLGNFTQKDMTGFQAAGLFNINHGSSSGVQAAGLFNQTADTLNGVQLAGLMNVTRYSPVLFVQAAGLVNIVKKSEHAQEDSIGAKGVQVAGLVNKSDALEGFQAAGLMNEVKNGEGVQVAGLMNSAESQKGVQVAGLLNYTGKMRGVQIGVFNSAKELHGVQIGLINRSGKRWLPLFNWGRK